MKRWTRDVLIAATTLALALPVVALAQRGSRGRPPGAGALVRVLEENSERLELKPAVLDQIRKIAEAERQAVGPLEERKRSAHEAMRALLDAPVPDEAKVMAQADVLGEIEIELNKERLRSLIAIRKLLGAKQLAELDKIQSERRAEMERRGPGPGRHRGDGPGFPPPPGMP